MGKRLSKIYTKTGDDGTTGLGDGKRVYKDEPRVEAYGTIDEANSAIGVILSNTVQKNELRDCLINIQHDLFEIGGELCIPSHKTIDKNFIKRLEEELDEFNKNLPPLKEFILPGVGPEHAWLKDTGRAEYVVADDDEALEAFKEVTKIEGIMPALETAHALAYVKKLAPTMKNKQTIVVNVSGRGDKDINTVASIEGIEL